ncbi:MAG: hypothetical protein IJ671_05510 [Succinivibrio sp.]|nr:hypothetical protein [Succinivibrio sp.]MBR1612977.1 hypothetical protein [Succinivibrio sp.]
MPLIGLARHNEVKQKRSLNDICIRCSLWSSRRAEHDVIDTLTGTDAYGGNIIRLS